MVQLYLFKEGHRDGISKLIAYRFPPFFWNFEEGVGYETFAWTCIIKEVDHNTHRWVQGSLAQSFVKIYRTLIPIQNTLIVWPLGSFYMEPNFAI